MICLEEISLPIGTLLIELRVFQEYAVSPRFSIASISASSHFYWHGDLFPVAALFG